MTSRVPTFFVALLMLSACDGQIGDSSHTPSDSAPELPEEETFTEDTEVEIDFPGRRVTRMTASQFHRSLRVATGQTWSLYSTYAASLGEPDFAGANDDARDISITFVKFSEDAARETCREAVAVPLEEGNVIFREASPSDRPDDPTGRARIDANLTYLTQRFLGREPSFGWLETIRQLVAMNPDGSPLTAPNEDTMRTRWWSVCVTLATHPDFYTY